MSGTWASTLFPSTRSARRPSPTRRSASSTPKNSTSVGDAPLLGGARDVRGRIDPEHRYALRQEVLQQVAVVRGELDDEAVGRELEAGADHVDVRARVLDPRVRVRGEVGVLVEDLVRRNERRELREPALRADAHVQGKERLHRLEPVGRQEALAERRLAEVDHRQLERRFAEAAVRSAVDHGVANLARGPVRARRADGSRASWAEAGPLAARPMRGRRSAAASERRGRTCCRSRAAPACGSEREL